MIIDPRNFEGFNRVLTGVVVPRPIAFVSTVSAGGLVNLAPYSFFNAVAYDPPPSFSRPPVTPEPRRRTPWRISRKPASSW